MSQSAINAAPRSSNRLPGSKDTDPAASSVAARLRSKQQTNESGPKPTKEVEISGNQNSQRLQTSADRSQAVDFAPARMTRHQRVTSAPSEDSSSTHQDGESPPLSASSTEAVSQICLCQPDPKIPRPRNAFILYRQSNQQKIISENRGLSNPEISKIAGGLWRSESDDIKKKWKELADQEKARHAEQYPDYRFQPRHKSKESPTTGPGQKVRCQKCGGQSIASNSSPFPTPLLQPEKRVRIAIPTSASKDKTDSDPRKEAMLNAQAHAHPSERYVPAGGSLTRKHPDGTIELSDPKRRRYDTYSGAVSTRPELMRTVVTNGQTPTSGHAPPYPSPRFSDLRRGSLSAHPDTPYYGQRGSLGSSADSPPPHLVMAPQKSGVSGISGRNQLHAYPATPSTVQHHGLPYSTSMTSRPRSDSESLRLAPLLSPAVGDHNRSIAAMIMTIPVLGKLSTLRRIAPPIKEALNEPTTLHVRGSIIAVEGDDRRGAEAMLGQLETYLRRNDEFDVRVLTGPRDPQPGCTLRDYLDMVSQWHEETKKIIEFLTGVEYQRVRERRGSESMSEDKDSSSTAKALGGANDPMDTDLEEGEVRETAPGETNEAREQNQELEKKKEEMAAAVEREARRQSAAADHSSKIPLLLISNYVLSGSNAWASMLPINDVYSPADHWAWTATLWRGIVGADLTVYVRNVEQDRAELVSAGPGGAGPSPMERKVEMKDEVGAILVKRDGGKVEDGAVRRVAFEVGEWVRMQAGKHS